MESIKTYLLVCDEEYIFELIKYRIETEWISLSDSTYLISSNKNIWQILDGIYYQDLILTEIKIVFDNSLLTPEATVWLNSFKQ